MTLTIRQAGPGDYDTVMGLLADSIRWLRGKGLDQWSEWRRWPAKMDPAFLRGDVWLVHDDGDPVCTITNESTGDPDFWTAAELAEPAAYLSKGAVRRDRAGQGLGLAMREWAIDRAYRQGCRWVRLDVWKSNTTLQDYYRANGLCYLRTVDVPGRRSGALFQIPTRPAQRPLIVEEPAMPTLPTTAVAAEGPDPADNIQPGHLHSGGAVIDYPWAGRLRNAVWDPDCRYRIRELHDDVWTLEASPAGASWWETHGTVHTAAFPLHPGSVYIITHSSGDPCSMSIVERAAEQAAAVAA